MDTWMKMISLVFLSDFASWDLNSVLSMSVQKKVKLNKCANSFVLFHHKVIKCEEITI